MGNNPNDYRHGDDFPVEQVSWEDCQEFLRKLSERDGRAYRLPTESEWEYACRAGTTTQFYFGETISTDQVKCVGKYPYSNGFPPNALGLHDMYGSVEEWCRDWDGAYPLVEAVDPQGPQSGDRRVLRGGSFLIQEVVVRSAFRNRRLPKHRNVFMGIRATRTFP
jgi:formylglycine-generating enzyme required for sulfatase activity